jgi:hypothetical protein
MAYATEGRLFIRDPNQSPFNVGTRRRLEDFSLEQVAELNLSQDELLEFWQEHPWLGPLQRQMQALREVVLPRVPGRLVVFVDEIDAVRSLPFSTDEFFAGIREFYNRLYP